MSTISVGKDQYVLGVSNAVRAGTEIMAFSRGLATYIPRDPKPEIIMDGGFYTDGHTVHIPRAVTFGNAENAVELCCAVASHELAHVYYKTNPEANTAMYKYSEGLSPAKTNLLFDCFNVAYDMMDECMFEARFRILGAYFAKVRTQIILSNDRVIDALSSKNPLERKILLKAGEWELALLLTSLDSRNVQCNPEGHDQSILHNKDISQRYRIPHTVGWLGSILRGDEPDISTALARISGCLGEIGRLGHSYSQLHPGHVRTRTEINALEAYAMQIFKIILESPLWLPPPTDTKDKGKDKGEGKGEGSEKGEGHEKGEGQGQGQEGGEGKGEEQGKEQGQGEGGEEEGEGSEGMSDGSSPNSNTRNAGGGDTRGDPTNDTPIDPNLPGASSSTTRTSVGATKDKSKDSVLTRAYRQVLEAILDDEYRDEDCPITIMDPTSCHANMGIESYNSGKAIYPRYIKTLLSTAARSEVRPGTSGRKIREIHRSATDGMCFNKAGPSRGVDTAVAVCLDSSGSMDGDLEVVGGSCCALMEALQGARAKVRAWRYGCKVEVAKNPRDLRKVSTMGGTNTTGVLRAARMWLEGCPERKKIVFVFTDGHPNNSKSCGAEVIACRSKGITVVCAGVAGLNANTLEESMPGAHLFTLEDGGKDIASGFKAVVRRAIMGQ